MKKEIKEQIYHLVKNETSQDSKSFLNNYIKNLSKEELVKLAKDELRRIRGLVEWSLDQPHWRDKTERLNEIIKTNEESNN